jgi:type 1 glutamine amidotransferase
MQDGGYAWKASNWTLVNLNTKHYITNHNIDWNGKVSYTSSDCPAVEKSYPGIELKDDSEVFINHRFTDGREKTVLCGLIYTDKATDKKYMQDRGAWTKRQGKGTVVYLMPGHCESDYQNENIARIVLNAVNWQKKPQTP